MKKLKFKKNYLKNWDPVDKNGPPWSPNGPIGPIFLRLSPIGELEFTAYSQLPIPFPSYRNRVISKVYGAFAPPRVN